MSTHTEWLDAGYTAVEILPPDKEGPDGQFTDGANLGLILGTADGVAVVIEGSPAELISLHLRIGQCINALGFPTG